MYTISDLVKPLASSVTDPSFVDFAERFLAGVPEPFWINPASTTGKHHPQFSLGQGGLVRHTVMAMYHATRWANFLQLSEMNRDIALVATCLHDTYKGGEGDEWNHTLNEHANLAADKIEEFGVDNVDIHEVYVHRIAEGVRSHMGFWSVLPNDPKTAYQWMLNEMNPVQKCVALADYSAAQKIYDQVNEVLGVLPGGEI